MAPTRETAVKPQFSQRDVAVYFCDRLFGLLAKSIWPGSIVIIVYLVTADAIPYLAGRTTSVSVFGQFITSFAEDNKGKVELILIVNSIGWAITERVFRLIKVEKLQGRIKFLEAKIDPSRTSSELTPKGLTNPGDK